MATAHDFIVDLQATVDYLASIIEEVDSMPFEDLVSLQDEANRVKQRAADLVSLINSELINQLEAGARELPDGRLFKRTKKYVDRHDHDLLIGLAVDKAIDKCTDKTTGEIHARHAAEFAARNIAKMFLSPSMKAKVTVVEKMGVDREQYETREFKEYGVLVIEEDQ